MTEILQPVHSVGHDGIDAQHEHIHELIVALTDAEAVAQSDTADVMLEHLARYMKWHFKAEEEVMAEAQYTFLEQHREEHRACSAFLDQLADELKRTSRLDMTAVRTCLTEWLQEHTLMSDQKAFAYICSSRRLPENP